MKGADLVAGGGFEEIGTVDELEGEAVLEPGPGSVDVVVGGCEMAGGRGWGCRRSALAMVRRMVVTCCMTAQSAICLPSGVGRPMTCSTGLLVAAMRR